MRSCARPTKRRLARRGAGCTSGYRNTQVTSGTLKNQFLSQTFCSALPVHYSDIPEAHWSNFARLVLEAAYEATLLAALINAQQSGSHVVYLTERGGGAFGNNL